LQTQLLRGRWQTGQRGERQTNRRFAIAAPSIACAAMSTSENANTAPIVVMPQLSPERAGAASVLKLSRPAGLPKCRTAEATAGFVHGPWGYVWRRKSV
jgi:hypothetical protein